MFKSFGYSVRPATLRGLPKAEVHVHLEGCFGRRPQQWAGAAGVSMPRRARKSISVRRTCRFLHFLDWACGLADTQERLARMAYDFCERLQSDGTGYADVIVNPTHWSAWRGRTKMMIEALDRGFTSAEQDELPPVGLSSVCCETKLRMRPSNSSNNSPHGECPRVVALSVDGNEVAAGRTGPRFAHAFRRAGEAGLKRTVHAGQSSGPEGVRDAIELLGADRIDHGVRAIKERAVMALLVERGIPLGVCPTSNIAFEGIPLNGGPSHRSPAPGGRVTDFDQHRRSKSTWDELDSI